VLPTSALLAASPALPIGVVVALIAAAVYGINQHERSHRRKLAAERANSARHDVLVRASEALQAGTSLGELDTLIDEVEHAHTRVLGALTDPDDGLIVSWEEAGAYAGPLEDALAQLRARRDELTS